MRGVCLAAFAVLAGCGEDGTAGQPASITLPGYPFVANDSITVNPSAIETEGGRYCRDAQGEANSVDFLLGRLPMGGIDRICAEAATPGAAESILGDLYLSGYFGGIWLRDSLAGDSAAAVRALVPPPSRGATTRGLGESVFQALANLAGDRLALARNGDDAEVIAAATGSLPVLLTLYGYNLGYIQVAVENPPTPEQSIPSPISCTSFLGCNGTAEDLKVLARYSKALARIESPPSTPWAVVADQVARYGEGSVSAGRGVWEGILGSSTIAAAAYQPLLDLSAGYLLVSEAAVLANATASADGDPRAARCGTLIQTGLVVWSGSYFEGLASSAPAGTFPTLECPGA